MAARRVERWVAPMDAQDCWVFVRADSMVVVLVTWTVVVMAVTTGVMLAVLSADEWDAKMVASKDALKAGMTVDSKAGSRGFSRVVRSVEHSAVGSVASWAAH